MENKYLITTLVILVLGLLLSGCGAKEETTPTDTTNEETNTGEKTENKTPTAENVGKSCEVVTDCGIATKESQPFCIGGTSYQKIKVPRCTLDRENNRICSYRMVDKRLGTC